MKLIHNGVFLGAIIVVGFLFSGYALADGYIARFDDSRNAYQFPLYRTLEFTGSVPVGVWLATSPDGSFVTNVLSGNLFTPAVLDFTLFVDGVCCPV